MEKRKIVVVQTRTQTKSVIMSAATTLGELKVDLRNAGIDYSDMSFFEGISKTELKTDSSVLPHDVPYKGQTTNELVFMLTNTNKKIKSGAETLTRAELYAAIKSLNLQEECKKRFGRNFTMCKTPDLVSLVQEYAAQETTASAPENENKSEDKSKTALTAESKFVDKEARKAICKLLDFLGDIFEYEERKEVLDILNERGITASPKSEDKLSSSYSDHEIDSMFNDMDFE